MHSEHFLDFDRKITKSIIFFQWKFPEYFCWIETQKVNAVIN